MVSTGASLRPAHQGTLSEARNAVQHPGARDGPHDLEHTGPNVNRAESEEP